MPIRDSEPPCGQWVSVITVLDCMDGGWPTHCLQHMSVSRMSVCALQRHMQLWQLCSGSWDRQAKLKSILPLRRLSTPAGSGSHTYRHKHDGLPSFTLQWRSSSVLCLVSIELIKKSINHMQKLAQKSVQKLAWKLAWKLAQTAFSPAMASMSSTEGDCNPYIAIKHWCIAWNRWMAFACGICLV